MAMKKTSKNNLSQSGESLNLQRLFFFFAQQTQTLLFLLAANTSPFIEREVRSAIFMCASIFLSENERRNVLVTPEGKFKADLKKEIEHRFPGSMVIHLDATEKQGIPDLLILYRDKWAALEGKESRRASHRPNQDYYVNLMDKMSYAAFIYPENKEEILDELQSAFETGRPSRAFLGE